MKINSVIAISLSVCVLSYISILPAKSHAQTSNESKQAMAVNGSNVIMTNLEIIKSTYEGASSEENGQNLQKYLSDNVKWKEADGFPLAGTYIGF
jgi:LPS O-antigen subunit length determinant protein (WzzB/FepE family)